ncbi:hypothetical protein [Escherichia coli]|uniref:hypothetical protein n=1 Tax=Escherichia coli TaxID=562 RepID=UPI003890B7BA
MNATQRNHRPLVFIETTLAQTDRNSYYKELPVVIKNNTARTVLKGLFTFEVNDGLTPLIQNIYFGGNFMHGEPRNIRFCIRANRGSNGFIHLFLVQ